MVSRKMIWDSLDVMEGKKKGSSYKALQKEKIRQGIIIPKKKTKIFK